MLFQWCVGGHCVGNVPIYAHQSFSKPNTEKWTKGQELLHTPLFSRFANPIFAFNSFDWVSKYYKTPALIGSVFSSHRNFCNGLILSKFFPLNNLMKGNGRTFFIQRSSSSFTDGGISLLHPKWNWISWYLMIKWPSSLQVCEQQHDFAINVWKRGISVSDRIERRLSVPITTSFYR